MLLYSVSDKIVFSILKRINFGFLEVTTFSGVVLKFGNPNDKLKTNLKIYVCCSPKVFLTSYKIEIN